MKKFVFVIDESPLFWNYALAGDTIQEIKNVPCVSPGTIGLAKSKFNVQRVEDYTVANCAAIGTTRGVIYQVLPKSTLSLSSVILLVSLFFITLQYGCSSNRELMYRYTSKQTIKADTRADTLVAVNVSFQDVPSAAKADPLTIPKLDPTVQKELVRDLGKIVSTSDSLFNYLGTPFKSAPADKSFATEKFSFSRRAIIAVNDLSMFDADRISKIAITLKDPSHRIRFTNCDKIITQYQTINLGTFGFNNSKYGEVNGGLTYGGTAGTSRTSGTRDYNGDTSTSVKTLSGTAGVSLTGKLGYSNALTGNATYQQRSIALSASFKDDSLTFYQDGTTGINLNGTIISDVTFEFTGDNVRTYLFYDFDNLFDKNNLVITPDKVTVNRSILSMPQLNRNETIPLNLEYTIVYRQVTENDKYLPEGYHNVNFIKGTVKKENHVVMIRAKDLLPKQWVIYDTVSGNTLNTSLGGQSAAITFNNYEKATNFMRWILRSANISTAISSDGYLLTVGGGLLTNALRGQLMVVPN